jgi:hypothetical protein
MFAFVGYIVHANGITFPWAMTMDGTPFPQGLSPPDAWDAIPDAGKYQIFGLIGFLEYVSYDKYDMMQKNDVGASILYFLTAGYSLLCLYTH